MFDADHLDALDGICFITSLEGIIEAVGEFQWQASIAANSVPELAAESVIGRSLFGYISGREVRDQLKHVMDKLKTRAARAWVMPFRCDAPDRQRNMRQAITPVFTKNRCSGFLFQSIELETNQRPPVNLFDFKELKRREEEEAQLPLVASCSWCQNVRFAPIGGEKWLHAEQYYANGGRSGVRLTHSICDSCLELVSRSFRN